MKKVLSLLLVLVLAVSIIACATTPDNDGTTETQPGQTGTQEQGTQPANGGGDTPPVDDGSPRHGGILRSISGGSAEGAGPIGVPWGLSANDIEMAIPMLEPMVRELADGSVEGLLAESWRIDDSDPDNLRLFFYLRQGVRFHDGTPFNAEVAKWNLDMANEYAVPMANFSDVRVEDNYTISMAIPSVSNATVGSFGGMMYAMISMEAYLANGTEWAEENPTGTGPFVLVEYIRGAHVITRRNDDYWDGDKPFFDGLELHLLTDTMTQTLALQAEGESAIHMMTSNVGEQVEAFIGSPEHNVIFTSNLNVSLLPNTASPESPFYNNPALSRALSYAIDRDLLVHARGFGLWVPAYQYTASARPSHVHDPGYGVPRYNQDRAREMLAEAGFPDGLSITLIPQPGAADRDAVVAIAAMLEDVGFDVSMDFLEAGAFSTMRGVEWPADAVFVHAVLSMTHMENSVGLLFSQASTFFYSLRKSDHMESMVQAAFTLGDNTQQLRALQDYMLDEGLIIPLWFVSSGRIMRTNLRGWNEFNQWFHADGWFAY